MIYSSTNDIKWQNLYKPNDWHGTTADTRFIEDEPTTDCAKAFTEDINRLGYKTTKDYLKVIGYIKHNDR